MRKILSLICLLLLVPAAVPAQDAALTVDQARRLMEENADNPRFVILDGPVAPDGRSCGLHHSVYCFVLCPHQH